MLTPNFKFLNELQILKKPTNSQKILDMVGILEKQLISQKTTDAKTQCFLITRKLLQAITNYSGDNFSLLEKKFINKYQPPVLVKAALYQIEATMTNHLEALKTEQVLLKKYQFSDLLQLVSNLHLLIKYIWLQAHPHRGDILGLFEAGFYLSKELTWTNQLSRQPPLTEFFTGNIKLYFQNYAKILDSIDSNYVENTLAKFKSVASLKNTKYYAHFIFISNPSKDHYWIVRGQKKILTLLLVIGQLNQLCEDKKLTKSHELINYNIWIRQAFLKELQPNGIQLKELTSFLINQQKTTRAAIAKKNWQIHKIVRKWWLQIGPKEWFKTLTIILSNCSYSQAIVSHLENLAGDFTNDKNSPTKQKEMLSFLFYQKTPVKILFKNEAWLAEQLEENVFKTNNYCQNYPKLVNIWWQLKNPKIFPNELHYGDQFVKLWPSKEIVTSADFRKEVVNFLRMWKLHDLLSGDDYDSKIKYLKAYLLDLINLQAAAESTYPLVLSIMFRYLEYDKNSLLPEQKTRESLREIIHLLQVYVIRLFVVQKRSPNVGKIFNKLIGLVDLPAIKEKLSKNPASTRLPTLKEFITNLQSTNKIHMDARKPMLRTIIHHITPEEEKTAQWWKQLTQLTVEHIMPRNPLNWEEWVPKDSLPQSRDEWQKEHGKHLNLLGNLLLLSDADNKMISNHKFSEKMAFYKKIKTPLISQKAGIQLMDITKIKDFTFPKIRRRSQHLVKIIIDLYKLPGETVPE